MIPLPTLQRILDRARDINSGRDSELSFDAQDELDIEALAAWAIAVQWQPIETAQIKAFVEADWYKRATENLLLIHEGHVIVGSYSYTKNGKGRWKSIMGHGITPTHWQLLPSPPELSGRAT